MIPGFAHYVSRKVYLCVDGRVLSSNVGSDGDCVAYKPITLSCILLMFIEMKFIHCLSCVTFAMKSIIMCND